MGPQGPQRTDLPATAIVGDLILVRQASLQSCDLAPSLVTKTMLHLVHLHSCPSSMIITSGPVSQLQKVLISSSM